MKVTRIYIYIHDQVRDVIEKPLGLPSLLPSVFFEKYTYLLSRSKKMLAQLREGVDIG